MKSRMDKYSNENNLPQRVSKNEQLYKDINKQELDKFKLNSNASVLENDGTNIDIEELKSILDRKYRSQVQRRSIFVPKEEETLEEKKIETKEYDINAILAKARETQEANYEEERFKKISETQYNILKSINLEGTKDKKEVTPEEENLMTLINTITAKELEQTEQMNPLDILSDLKGSDNTEVIPAMNEAQNELEKNEENNSSIDKSFFTNSVKFKDEDFEGLEDTEEKNGSKVIIWILISVAIITFIGGIVFLLNKLLDLGLF